MSPTLSKLPNAFENFSVETLGEVVGQLVCGGNLEHFDISVANMVPKEVPLNQEVLGPIGDALLDCKEQSTIVVFKDAATDGGRKIRWKAQSVDNGSRVRIHEGDHEVATECACLH